MKFKKKERQSMLINIGCFCFANKGKKVRELRKIGKFTIAVTLSVSLFLPSVVGAEDRIKKDLEEKIQQNQMEQEHLEIDLEYLANQQIILSEQISEIDEKIREFDEKLMFLSMKKNEIKEEIEEKEKTVEVLEKQVEKIKKQKENFKEQLKKRLLAEQENDSQTFYLSLLFGATSFGNLIERTLHLKNIYDHDKEKIMRLGKFIEELNESEIQILEKINILENYHITLEEIDEYYNELQEERKEFMLSLMKLAEEARQKELEKEGKLQQLKKEKENLQKKLKEREELLRTYVIPGSSGTFLMPTTGHISSGFGERWGTMHYGIDIANKVGTPVIASANGTVKWANYVNRYGNTVLIKHNINGKTYETLYAHLDKINVKIGQKVTQGQKIGEMGNTGRSFGSHLHFEIHVGGGWNQNKTFAKNPYPILNK
ncbi:murein hydrolase activator EnvC family protein [Calidifontibacillus erzurumensis]|uniref:murein hydrolase activator EnvC family protein n=1 Tax=Calidifontibacillus erzurumensis TaxID=2741433 RepID=UPI0035B51126